MDKFIGVAFENFFLWGRKGFFFSLSGTEKEERGGEIPWLAGEFMHR